MIAFFESFGVLVNFVILLIAALVAYGMHRVSRPFVHFAMVAVLGITLLSGYETWLGHPVTLAPITQSLTMASFHTDSLACLFQLLIIGGGWMAFSMTPERERGRAYSSTGFICMALDLLTVTINNYAVVCLTWMVTSLVLATRIIQDKDLKPKSRSIWAGAFVGNLALVTSLALFQSGNGGGALLALLVAVAVRAGFWPFHRSAARWSSLAPTKLLTCAGWPIAIAAVLRFGTQLDTSVFDAVAPYVVGFGLAMAFLLALLAMGEPAFRRKLGLLSSSHAGLALAGVFLPNPDGIIAAILQTQTAWIAISVCQLILIVCDARAGGLDNSAKNLGLSGAFPRLGVGFLVASVALIGLPGTIGFCDLDLLVHAGYTTNKLIGVLVPCALALNAMSVVKLHARIFLGPVLPGMDVIPDALPREHVPITVAIVFLLLVGLVPGKWVETVSLIAIEHPAFHEGGHTAEPNPDSH